MWDGDARCDRYNSRVGQLYSCLSIGERIAAIISQRDPAATRPALIVQPRARRALTALLRLRAPQCLVLSINELPAAQPIEVIAVVGDEAPATAGELGHETEALAA